jgi:hypothetical protein
MIMNRSITWLHLSDLHARLRDDWDSRQITDTLVKDLKNLQKDYALRPDFIFFTGDAVFGAHNAEKMVDQYQKVRAFLDSVRHAFEPEIPVRDVYLVPGNHDVDRNEITPDQTQWLRNPDRKLDEIIAAMRDGKKQWRTWMERLNAYRNFLTAYGLLHLQPEHPQLIWADAKEIAGLRIGIVGFNSAWSCADKQDKAMLWCGGEWQLSQLKHQLGPVSFSFALIHHPGNWFTGQEDPAFMRQMRQEFPLVLHGHEHLEWLEPDGEGRLVLSAGACYESSWMPNGYNIGQIDLDQRCCNVWLRQWDKTGRGWVARNIAGKTKDGVFAINNLQWIRQSASSDEKERIDVLDTTAVSSDDSDSEEKTKEHFTRRFCEHVIDQHDVLELFGCDIPRELQRHQLSVAYVSLNLSSEDGRLRLKQASIPDEKHILETKESAPEINDEEETDTSGAAFENVLDNVSDGNGRLMILGPAGAGKSTLLRWCAIHAAQQVLNGPTILAKAASFSRQPEVLDEWNRFKDEGAYSAPNSWRYKIPILIRLRDCPNGKLPAANDLPRFLAKHLPTAPADWMTDVLDAGRALVLFDGVDEIHRDQRPQLAEEIAELIRTYPHCTYVVTTRPGAVEDGWLERLEFLEARVEPMSRADREEFIGKWYNSASLELKHRPRPGEDLTRTAARLRRELTDQPELGVLASNPLLCAMICALYRERQERLPETPAELCEALVQMLLHRRERETPGLQDAHFLAAWRALQYPQKKGLLADLAWEMVSKGDSSISWQSAVVIIGEGLASTPGRKTDEAEEVVQALVERSGLLRPAGDDRIDFLHNTLKEYLAGGQAVENGDPRILITHADDAAWQPVILFALALAPELFSSTIVRQLLSRVPSPQQKHTRKVGALSTRERRSLIETSARDFFLVRCRRAAKRLAAELSANIDALTARLFPPAYMHEVEALAQLGPRILVHGAASLLNRKWWESHSYDARLVARCLRLLRLVGGERAAEALSLAQNLPVYSSLVTSEWMMACTELCDGNLPWPFRVQDRVYTANTRISDLRPLAGVLSLKLIEASNTQVSDLQPLADLKSLKRLDLYNTMVSDLRPLAGLTNLEDLRLQHTKVSDLSPLAGLSSMKTLLLDRTSVKDLSPLKGLTLLQRLDADSTDISDFSPLAAFSALQILYLQFAKISDLRPIASLTSLRLLFLHGAKVSDISPLVGLQQLQRLDLSRTGVRELEPLTMLPNLFELWLQETPVKDLRPLEGIASLRILRIQEEHITKNEIDRFRSVRSNVLINPRS